METFFVVSVCMLCLYTEPQIRKQSLLMLEYVARSYTYINNNSFLHLNQMSVCVCVSHIHKKLFSRKTSFYFLYFTTLLKVRKYLVEVLYFMLSCICLDSVVGKLVLGC